MTCRSIYILTAWLLASPLAQAASDHSNSRAGQSEWVAGQNGSAGNERAADAAGRWTSSHRFHRSASTRSAVTLTSASGSDQNDALDAVSTGEALPLSSLIKIVQQQGLGKVIEAKLLSVKDQLVYRLVLLSDDGIARPAYYAADTGRPVRAP